MINNFYKYIFENYDKFEPLTSFRLHDELNSDIWDGYEMDSKIQEQLIVIATDFFDFLDIDVEVDDVWLTGSLANLNYSKYSDFDVHILFDFSKVNDNTKLVKKYLDAKRFIFNDIHNIYISGYEVELYAQDTNEPHISTGVYSLMNGKWIRKPSKQNFEPDEELIKQKALTIMDSFDKLEEDKDKKTLDEMKLSIDKIWKKIKDMRKSGLYGDGELSNENLAFKLLRRNGYLEKIILLKREIYDKQFS